jgi:large subunit ribosomal protein L9
MQIILLETLNKLGKAGEVVSVKDGFAKNFLIPQKKAIIANKKNLNDLNSKMSQINENNMKKISEANELKAKLDGKEINIQMEANEDGNLYGNLGPRQIRDRLINDFSIDFEPGNIVLDNISAIGSYDVTLRIYDDISASLKLEITKKI